MYTVLYVLVCLVKGILYVVIVYIRTYKHIIRTIQTSMLMPDDVKQDRR